MTAAENVLARLAGSDADTRPAGAGYLANPDLQPAFERLSDLLLNVVSLLPLLLIAVIVVLAFTWLARWVRTWHWPFDHFTKKPFLRDLIAQIAGVVVFLFGALLALELLDATTLVGAVLGAAGIVGIALGFAFRDTAENYIAGLLLSMRQPFEPEDHVVIDEHEGYVMRLTPRATILFTPEGNHLRIPNARVFQGVMLNYSRNPKRRFNFSVGIGADVDILRAQQLAQATLERTAGILHEPPPWSAVTALGDSNVVLDVFAWVDQTVSNYAKTKSEAIRQVKHAFDEAQFDMPEPIYRLRIQTPSEAPRETVPSPAPVPVPAEEAPRSIDLSPRREVDQQMREDAAHDRADTRNNLLAPDAPRE